MCEIESVHEGNIDQLTSSSDHEEGSVDCSSRLGGYWPKAIAEEPMAMGMVGPVCWSRLHSWRRSNDLWSSAQELQSSSNH